MMSTTRLQRLTGAAVVAALVLLVPVPAERNLQAQFQTTPTLFSGQATALKGQVLGIPINPVDTGTIAPEGATIEKSLLCYPDGPNCVVGLPDLTNGAASAQVLNATVVAMGHQSRARASVAELSVNAAGQTVSATLVAAEASAKCTGGNASIDARAEVADLTINGETIVVSGEVNQKVPLPVLGGFVIINEQVATVNGGKGDITVRALHIVVPGLVDLIIAEAHADIQCGLRICPTDKDFVTGGGMFSQPARQSFAAAGGIKNGGFWGHLTFIDHATGDKVKGTRVTGYSGGTGTTVREIDGEFDLNGKPGGLYHVVVDDQGEPGRSDTFVLSLNGVVRSFGPTLDGGNIQLHTCK